MKIGNVSCMDLVGCGICVLWIVRLCGKMCVFWLRIGLNIVDGVMILVGRLLL